MNFFVRKQHLSAMLVFFSLQFPLNLPASEQYNKEFSFEMSDVTVKDVFSYIENNSEYVFLYAPSKNLSKKVNVDVKNKDINVVLEEILAHTGLDYKIDGKQIIIKESNASSKIEKQNQIDGKTIKGKVRDKSGEPIIGANIVLEGSNIGVITDIDGFFELKNIPEDGRIKVSFIGFKEQIISLKGKTYFDLILSDDSEMLDEIVVVGYGVQKKVNLSGSVATIDAKSIESRPVTNITNAIQGLMPGVTITSSTGQPGRDNATIRVRGVGTLNNSNPMYIVDGMPVSSLTDIDPNDIESLSVLKDAASSAIYGSRAANGVVLVTTKKGGDQKTKLKYDGFVGWQNAICLPEFLPSWENAQIYNMALKNEGKPEVYSPEDIEMYRNGTDLDNYPNTNWTDLFYKTGLMHNHRVEISGGKDGTTYMFSAGYMGQEGIVLNSNYDRYNIRGNINSKISKVLSASANLSLSYGDMNEPVSTDGKNLFYLANMTSPLFFPYKYSNGYYGNNGNQSNPMAELENGSINNEKWFTSRTVGNITYQPIKGLKIQENVGFEYKANSQEKFIKDLQYYNWKTGEPTAYKGPNNLSESRNNSIRLNLQTIINYDLSIKKHNLGFLGGFEQEYYRYDWLSGYRKDFLNNDLWELNAGSPDGQSATGSGEEVALRSYFGRLNYNYDDKYLFEFNIRHDGTSRISKENRWGTFPSFSAAWRISNEPFMDSLKNFLSDLKIRAGWGRLGNQSISTYPYQSVLASSDYSFGGKVNKGVALVDGANSDIMWETTESFNIGLDASFFSNQFTVSLDAYKKKTYDILMKLPVSPLYGLSAPYQNAGEVHNTGIESQLGYHYIHGDFTFNSLFNVTYNHNEVINLSNDGKRNWIDDRTFLQEGYPINSYGGYEAIGIFQTEEEVKNSAVINRDQAAPGDLKYKDQNGDGIINGDDRVYLGSSMPEWTFGANLSLEWKNFDISAFFQGVAGVQNFLSTWATGDLNSSLTYLYRDSWDAQYNPNGKFPRPLITWNQNNGLFNTSSFWIKNSSYMRLKNLQVGYMIPENIVKLLGIERIRIYYSGENLLTITGYPNGFDPEKGNTDATANPLLRTHTFGVNITF